MEENSETQEPGKKPRREDQKHQRSDAVDEVGRVVHEAAEAETNGQYALASLLALHALQLDPVRAEASAIFERCQAALGRVAPDVLEKGTPAPVAGLPPWAESREPGAKHPMENLFRDDALRHPIDLDGVAPLTPGPDPHGLGSRVVRPVLPFVILGLLVAGIWLASSRTGTGPAPVTAQPAVAEPQAAPDDPDPVTDPRPGALAPGTVALNIVPWAKVDAIYSVYDGHQIEPDGLVSPCTVSLPPGRYSFTVSHPDFGSLDLPVIVKSGEVTKVEHSLISNKELEKELAPALKSSGSPFSQTGEPAMQQSAALQR